MDAGGLAHSDYWANSWWVVVTSNCTVEYWVIYHPWPLALIRFSISLALRIAVKMIEQQHGHAIYQWTFHNSVIAAFVGWQDSRNDRTKAVRFGNKWVDILLLHLTPYNVPPMMLNCVTHPSTISVTRWIKKSWVRLRNLWMRTKYRTNGRRYGNHCCDAHWFQLTILLSQRSLALCSPGWYLCHQQSVRTDMCLSSLHCTAQ